MIHLENKHYKKTTLGELDDQLDVLRHLVRLAADQQLHPDKKPCLPMRKYEILSRKINEIGCMIGGYYKSLNGRPAHLAVLQIKAMVNSRVTPAFYIMGISR